MSFKKFAMLMITCAVFYGFTGMTASAATTTTTDGITNEQEAPEKAQTPAQDDKGDDTAVTPAPQPTATPAPQPTKKPAASKAPAAKPSKQTYTKAELRLMAAIINCEAGAESYQGKLAVGIVVMNRVRSKQFPNTVKKVIYQKRQFSPVRNGSLKKKLAQYDRGKTKSSQWRDCISSAKKALSGQKTIVYKGKVKSIKNYKFFSVRLRGAKMKLGGHRFK